METKKQLPYALSALESTKGAAFVAALVISFVVYYVLFAHILHKPQTIGLNRQLIEAKTAALQAVAGSQKIILLAGSNGRVSHSAKVIEGIVGLPAVNMSVTASLSIDFQLNRIKRYLKAGDVLYMPLEYGQLARKRKAVYSGAEAPYVIAYEKSSLEDFSAARKLNAYLYFDLHFLFSSIAEMGLSAMDFKRRITADDYNAWGDQTGHTIEKGVPYRDYLDSLDPHPATTVSEGSYSAKAVSGFLAWASDHGVIVVGGFPTYAQGEPVSAEAETALKTFYTSRGHYFLSLKNKGRYPKADFFDTVYHLTEPAQVEHSKLVGLELKKLLDL